MVKDNHRLLKSVDCSSQYRNVPVATKPGKKSFRSFCIEQEGMLNCIMENGVKKYSPIRFTRKSEQCTPESTQCLPFSSPSSFLAAGSTQNSSSSEEYMPLDTEDVLFSSKNDLFSPLKVDMDDTDTVKNNELFCNVESIMDMQKTLQISTQIPDATQKSHKPEDSVEPSVNNGSKDQSGKYRKSCINITPDELHIGQFQVVSQTSLNCQDSDTHSGSQTPKQVTNIKWKTCATTPTTSHPPTTTLPQQDLSSPQAVTSSCEQGGVAELLPGPSRINAFETFTTPEWRPLLYPVCAPKKVCRPIPRQYPPQCRRSLVRYVV